jgi:hypothetical protein
LSLALSRSCTPLAILSCTDSGKAENRSHKEKYGEQDSIENSDDYKSNTWNFENNCFIDTGFLISNYGTVFTLMYSNIFIKKKKRRRKKKIFLIYNIEK